MENASRALLMAGGILIAILIISMAVYMFVTYNRVETSYGNTMESNEKIKFNTNFTKFEGRKDITAQEIVTLINFAKNYKETNQITITITVQGSNMLGKNNDALIKFITDNPNKKFECRKNKDIGYDSNGIVTEIEFK